MITMRADAGSCFKVSATRHYQHGARGSVYTGDEGCNLVSSLVRAGELPV